MSFETSNETEKYEANEILENLPSSSFLPPKSPVNSTLLFPNVTSPLSLPPKSPSLSSVFTLKSPSINSLLPPKSPALSAQNLLPPMSPDVKISENSLFSLDGNFSLNHITPICNENSSNSNAGDKKIEAEHKNEEKEKTLAFTADHSIVMTPPFSPSRNQSTNEPTSKNFVSFKLDEHSTDFSPIKSSQDSEEKNEQEQQKEEEEVKIENSMMDLEEEENFQEELEEVEEDQGEEYKPPSSGMEEEEEEEEEYVEAILKEERDENFKEEEEEVEHIITPESTPSDPDEEFTFPHDDTFFEDDLGGMDFMTSKEAYRKENPMHAVLVPPGANNHNPWVIHNKMREEVQRQRNIIESLRIRQIQEEELAFARARQERDSEKTMEVENGMEIMEDVKNKMEIMEEEQNQQQEEEEEKEVEKIENNETKMDEDEESFEEPEIDYSQWTIGQRADVLENNSANLITPSLSLNTTTNVNIQTGFEMGDEEREPPEKPVVKKKKKYNKTKGKKKKQKEKKGEKEKKKKKTKKQASKKKKEKSKSTKKKKQQENTVHKPKRKRKKIQVRKVKEYMGVYTRGNGRFFCTARIEGRQKYVGSFSSPKLAALEYDKFVFNYRGENYSSYNFPELLGLDQDKSYKK